MEDKAHITPILLKWARESARMPRTAVALELSLTVAQLQDWESGTSQPTIKEAQALAKLYRRPFAVLFLPELPRRFRILRDF
jgi:DNA-binding transcriptional regulator YiaG